MQISASVELDTFNARTVKLEKGEMPSGRLAPLPSLFSHALFPFCEEKYFYQLQRHEKAPGLHLLPIHHNSFSRRRNYLLPRMSGVSRSPPLPCVRACLVIH